MHASLPVAEFKLSGIMRRRPPIVSVMFDAEFRNPNSEALWFLVPGHLNSSLLSRPGGVDGVEVFELTGRGRVVVGHFQGTQDFVALLLPAGAAITIRRFTLQLWQQLPAEEVSIEVVFAKSVTAGGEDASAWFGMNPASDASADVTTEGGRLVASKHTPDRGEVPLTVDEDRRMTIRVSLGEQTL